VGSSQLSGFYSLILHILKAEHMVKPKKIRMKSHILFHKKTDDLKTEQILRMTLSTGHKTAIY